MSSNINPNNIDGSYPVAGQDNNSQGFRDNFTNIKQNFQYAEDEINDLQNKAILKAALIGSTLDNNMNDNLIYAAKIQDFSATRVQVTPTGTPLTATLNYSSGHYQLFSTTASTTLAFSNFPAAGSYGYMKVQIQITNVAHTITLPAAVSLGLAGIQGINPGTSGVANSITFGATGYYEFGFGTSDGGTTITVFDLNRALTNFTAADIQTDDITATGFVSAAGNVTGGNLRTSGLMSAGGNVTGGNIITAGLVTASGNIRGGNLTTAGTISGTGNIVGVNLNGYLRPTAGGLTTTTAPLIFSSGSLVNSPTQTLSGGSFEYDGTVLYAAPSSNQRGLLPSEHLIVAAADYSATNSGTAQAVFDSPDAITLPGSTTYFFEALYVIVPTANMNAVTMSTLFNVTSALTDCNYLATTTVGLSSAVTASSIRQVSAPTSTVVTAAAPGGAASNFTVQLRGVFRTLSATTLTPQMAFSGTPGSSAIAVKKSSFFRCVAVGTDAVTNIGYWS